MINYTRTTSFETIFSSSFICKAILVLFIIFFHYAINSIYPVNEFAWMFTLIIWGIGVVMVRGSLPVVFVYLFIFSYIYAPYYQFIEHKQLSIYGDFQRIELVNQVAFLNTLFIGLLSLSLDKVTSDKLLNPSEWLEPNNTAFVISLAPCLLALQFGLTGASVLDVGYGGGSSTKTPLHEYFVIFFAMSLLFMNRNSKFQHLTVAIILLMYCLKTLMYGGRIEVIQAGLVYLYIVFNYLRDSSRLRLYSSIAILVLVMTIIGAARGNFAHFWASLNSMSGLFTILFAGRESPYVLSTSADVYYASMRLVGLVNDGLLHLESRLLSFTSFIFNLPLSFSSLKENANLAAVYSKEFQVGGGGMISAYFYVWFGYLGVISAALFVGFFIKRLHGQCGYLTRVYGFVLLVTFPRWWAYTPINLTKMCVVAMGIYVFLMLIKSNFSEKS